MPWNTLLSSTFIISLLASGIRLATPLLFTSLGETIAERAGIMNIGIEGLMLMGALSGYLVGYFTQNAWLGALAALIVGIVFSFLHAYLTATLAGNQIISGLAVNLLTVGLATIIIRSLLGVEYHPSSPTFSGISIPILADIPFFGATFFQHNFWVYLSWLLVPLIAWLLARTTWGLNIKAAGENPLAAEAAGVSVQRVRFWAVVAGGALAGIGGMTLTLMQLGYFKETMVAGRGFIAIAIVTMGRWRPWSVFAAALLFGVADSLQFRLQALGLDTTIPLQVFLSLPYVLAIIVVTTRAGKLLMPTKLTVPFSGTEAD
jgi:general nucleoside transport system permease protein